VKGGAPPQMGPAGGRAQPRTAWVGILLVALLCGSVLSFTVAFRQWGPLPLASVQGRMIDHVIATLLAITVAFFIASQFFLALPLLRGGRRGNQDFVPPALTRMPGIAAIITIAVLVVADGAVLAVSEGDWLQLYSPPPADALQIDVRGRQFTWVFRYPGPDGRFGRTDPGLISSSDPFGRDPTDPAGADDLVVVNDLHLPVGRPVAFRISALDVIHSFNVPSFRIKQDAVPGRLVTVWVTPDRVGTYEIACAQLCGVGHYTMRGSVTVESPRAFARWMTSQEASRDAGRRSGPAASVLARSADGPRAPGATPGAR
jgi:cytochrome c oxidase subunit 2